MKLNPPLPSEEPTAEVSVAAPGTAATGDPTSPADTPIAPPGVPAPPQGGNPLG